MQYVCMTAMVQPSNAIAISEIQSQVMVQKTKQDLQHFTDCKRQLTNKKTNKNLPSQQHPAGQNQILNVIPPTSPHKPHRTINHPPTFRVKHQKIIGSRLHKPLGSSVSSKTPVSKVQHRATFSFVYPPPPVTCTQDISL